MNFKTFSYLLLFILIPLPVLPQQAMDTLFANERQQVALFFPAPIKRAITGNTGYVFTYDRENASHLGLLQAVPGKISNLLVICTDDTVYSFLLKYRRELTEYYRFIDAGTMIGPAAPRRTEKKESPLGNKDRARMQHLGDSILQQSTAPLASRKKKGLRLRLMGLSHSDRYTYLSLEVGNRSKVDFEIDGLDIHWQTGKQKRRAAYQEIRLTPVYRYREPHMVRAGEAIRFVYVFRKFVLASGQRMQFTLRELNGNRRLVLQH